MFTTCSGTTKTQAEQIVDGIFDAIVGEMKKGGEVSVSGFGIFLQNEES